MKKSLSLFLALMMTVMSLGVFAAGTYTASDWAKAELTKAEEKALIPDSLLNEDLTKSITRAEFAAVSVLLYEAISADKAEPVGTNPFTDTSDAYVLKAYNLGVTTGTSETTFSPNDLLTREQAAAMLTRVYKKLSINGWEIAKDGEFKLEYTKGESFADDADVSDWAKDSVYFMSSKSIINGVGENKFAPKNNASREQAIIIATRMTDLEITLADGIRDIDPYEEEREKPAENTGKDTFTIGFIGGSLTEGGGAWIKMTKDFLQAKMPDKEIVTINAGKGGTRSSYGTARFMQDIGQYAPDMVFIDFSVNDCRPTYDVELNAMYTEGILRQCAKLPKKPIVILLHCPHPDMFSTNFEKCEQTMAAKNRVAASYGVETMDLQDYMEREYEATKKEKGYKDFADYLATMYKRTGDSFDNHGGYDKFGEAIIEELTKDYDKYMKPIQLGSMVHSNNRNVLEATYNHIFVNDARLNFSGPWKTYTESAQVPTNDSSANIGAKQFSYPFFPTGIKQVVSEQAAVGFITKAKAIALNIVSSNKGGKAKVYVDNEEVGTFSCKNSSHNINYNTDFITLPNDGKQHKVIIVVEPAATDAYVFRFGSIIERF